MLAQAAGGLAGGEDADSVQEASLELGWVLCWSEGYAWSQVEFGRDLVGRLPMVLAALRSGCIDRDRAWAFVDALRCIEDDEVARRIATRLLPKAERWTLATLRERLRYHVDRAEPGAARRRYRSAVAQRGCGCAAIMMGRRIWAG